MGSNPTEVKFSLLGPLGLPITFKGIITKGDLVYRQYCFLPEPEHIKKNYHFPFHDCYAVPILYIYKGGKSCPAIFNNNFRVLRQVMLLLVTLFASLALVSSGRQVCTYTENDTWAQVDIELNIITYITILFILYIKVLIRTFLTISRRFPTLFRRFFRPHVRFPTFSETFRRFPRITE